MFDGTMLTRALQNSSAELLAQGISYDVPDRGINGSLKRILHNVSIRVRPSEFIGIIGANGSGKSTLINILAGRASPSEGSVRFNDLDLHTDFESLKRDIAYLAQQEALHEKLTLRQALDYTARLRLPRDTIVVQRCEAVHTAARSVGLLSCSPCQVVGTTTSCLFSKLFSLAAVGQSRRHDHETTVNHALMRELVIAGPVMRRGASSV